MAERKKRGEGGRELMSHLLIRTLILSEDPTLMTSYKPKEVKVKLLSHVRLFVTLWTVVYQSPLSIGFSRQEYWSGLPFPSPGDLPNPGIEPGSPTSRQTLYHLSHQRSLNYLNINLNYIPKGPTSKYHFIKG